MISINPDKINSKELFELVARAKAKHDFIVKSPALARL